MKIWQEMYDRAREVQRGRVVSPFVDAGGVAAAILSESGRIYVGVCIDTCSGLGMCAERNAVANMLTCGESRVRRVLAIMPDGRLGSPCGACREMLMQLDAESPSIEILLSMEEGKTVTLGELMPDWWGKDRFDSQEVEKCSEV